MDFHVDTNMQQQLHMLYYVNGKQVQSMISQDEESKFEHFPDVDFNNF